MAQRDRPMRLAAIRTLIHDHIIGSQKELRSLLLAQGISVTQATLSRDLKLLPVGKVTDGRGGYTYTMVDQEGATDTIANYVHDLLRGWLSIEFSQNLAVIHTLPGHADSVAIAIDNMEIEAVVGTVAGDDTIIVVLKPGVSQAAFVDALSSSVPQLASMLGDE